MERPWLPWIVGIGLLAVSAQPIAADGSHAGASTHVQPQATARFEPPPVGSYELPAIGTVEERQLLGSDGEPAPLLGLAAGEVAVISFVYLSCGEACPLATASLHRLDAQLAQHPELARRVRLVTLSFDPARDSPERLQALRDSLTPQGRWQFLTARDAAAIAPVLADFGQDAVWVPDSDSAAPDRLRHVLKVFLVDHDGAIRNIYSTGLLDVRLIENDARTVLAEFGIRP